MIRIIISALALFFAHGAWAAEVLFVNGIQNELGRADLNGTALYSARKLLDTMNLSVNHQGSQKRTFPVTLVYNPIGFYGTTSLGDLESRQDWQELFLLKVAEEHYLFDIFKIPTWYTNKNSVVDRAAARNVLQYLEDMTPGNNSVEGSIPSNAMDMTKATVNSLIAAIHASPQAIVVAHSEGNLLTNLAYAHFARNFGNGLRKKLRVVNVANTSRIAVSGFNLTHANDGALFAAATTADFKTLEKLPSSGNNWIRTTAECSNSACDLKLVAPMFSGTSAGGDDVQHGFVETYLSNATVNPIIDQGIDWTPGATRLVDRFEDLVYTAAYALEAAQTSNASIVFDEDFGNGIDNTQLWDYGATSHSEQNGFLMTWMQQTDVGGTISTKNLPYLNKLHIHLIHYMQPGNDYFFPSVGLDLANDESFSLVWQRSAYGPDYCNNANYFNKIRISYGPYGSHCPFVSNLTSSNYYNRWVYSVIVYDALSGSFLLDIGADATFEFTATLPPEKRASVRKISLSTYGWYVNHFHAYSHVRVVAVE